MKTMLTLASYDLIEWTVKRSKIYPGLYAEILQGGVGGGGGVVVVVGELGVFKKKRGVQLQKWNVKKKLVAKVRSWASHNFCEHDRHLFIFGKYSLPMVFFRLHLVEQSCK